jgi:hypothetical protein
MRSVAFRAACHSLDPQCYHRVSASCHVLQRQVSAVRAVCGNSACTDLCGGAVEVNSCPTTTVTGKTGDRLPMSITKFSIGN